MKVWIVFLFIMVGCFESKSFDQVSEEEILGEDKDKNGVRDDVDRFIEQNFDGINIQNAAKQYAKYRIETLKFRNDKKMLELNSDNINKAQSCFKALNPENRVAYKDFRKIRAKIINTKSRILAMAQGSETLAGSVMAWRDYGIEGCEFEIELQK